MRRGDMDRYSLLIVKQQDDGDMVVIVQQISEGVVEVEFCTPAGGGGRSPKTHEALINLLKAMEEDSAADDQFASIASSTST